MPLGPAYPIDSRVQIHYLYDDVPNREEFREALAGRKLPSVIREGLRATRTLLAKRLRIIQAIRNISSGIKWRSILCPIAGSIILWAWQH